MTKWTAGAMIRNDYAGFASPILNVTTGRTEALVYGDTYEEADGRSRLMAAAPELYDALEEMVSCFQRVAYDLRRQAAVANAHAALAKVRPQVSTASGMTSPNDTPTSG